MSALTLLSSCMKGKDWMSLSTVSFRSGHFQRISPSPCMGQELGVEAGNVKLGSSSNKAAPSLWTCRSKTLKGLFWLVLCQLWLQPRWQGLRDKLLFSLRIQPEKRGERQTGAPRMQSFLFSPNLFFLHLTPFNNNILKSYFSFFIDIFPHSIVFGTW